MKQLFVIMLLSLTACSRESLPDGRSKIRDEKIQLQIDQLQNQNNAILDSIKVINTKLKELQRTRSVK